MSTTTSREVAAERHTGRAFAIRYEDLRVWSVNSFFDLGWRWPPEHVKPLGTALRRRRDVVDKAKYALGAMRDEAPLVTLHFDGSMERRKLGRQDEFKGQLFFGESGDVIYSKIDVRNGAIGVVPQSLPRVAVSSEYPVYEVLPTVALPQYIQLLVRTRRFLRAINTMISGTSGRKRVQPTQLEEVAVPLPPIAIQIRIVEKWQESYREFLAAQSRANEIIADLDAVLRGHFSSKQQEGAIANRHLTVLWDTASRWDLKTARAAAFRAANPSFRPLGECAEEATELVRPWEKPEKDWPVYGVNNKVGVFFSHYQKGKDFNAVYKRIRKDWFFHNPTRAVVGSLGIVPEVPEDAITSPEYQVWRVSESKSIPGYLAALIRTPFFIELIKVHRVGAVKQRLYVENLLQIPVPSLPDNAQQQVAKARREALERLEKARNRIIETEIEVEDLIVGDKSLDLTQ